MNGTKSYLFKNINKIDKFLARFFRKQKEEDSSL